jgi:hypothetical protein
MLNEVNVTTTKHTNGNNEMELQGKRKTEFIKENIFLP